MAQSDLVKRVLTLSTSLILYPLKEEIITAKTSFNISLCNSKSSVGQMLENILRN